MTQIQLPTVQKELAISYLRFSDAIQGLGDSTRRQRSLAQAYADRHNLEIVEELRDLGVSAFRGRNATSGAWGAMINMAQQGIFQRAGIKHVLVEGFDRMSRMEPLDALFLFKQVLDTEMTVHMVKGNGSIFTREALRDTGKLLVSIIEMAAAHQESVNKSHRLLEKRAENRTEAREGKKQMTTVAPYWLHWDDEFEWNGRKGWFKPYPNRQKVVRDIYELTADGATVYSICRTLSEREEPTFRIGKGSAKNGWSTSYISRILNSKEVLGEMQPKKLVNGKPVPDGDPIFNYYPPVVDVDLYNRAQAARRQPNHKGRTGADNEDGASFTNLFRGLLLCGCCKDSATGEAATMNIRGNLKRDKKNKKKVKTYQYLICTAKRKGGGPAHETKKNWRYDAFEKLFLDHVTDFDVTGLLKRQVAESPEQIARKQIEEAKYKVHTLEAEVENLAKQLDNATSERTGEFIQKRIDKKLADLGDAEADLKRLQIDFQTAKIREDRRVQSIETIEAIKVELAQAEGMELYRLRERLAFAIKQMVTGIHFDPDGAVDVIVFGGIKAFRFRDGKLEDQFNLIPRIEAGGIPVEAYTGDGKDYRDAQNRTVIVEDTEKRRKFEKLKGLQ
jgi:hypothetical protein